MAKVTPFSQFHNCPVESRWFTVWDIAPGIKAIYEPYHFQEVISYLIEGETEAILWDAGMGIGNIKALAEGLTDKPITLVCSHSHFDHVGDAWRFGEAHLLNVAKCVHLLEEGYSLPADDYNRSAEAFSLTGEPWFDAKSWCIPPCKVVPVENGHVYDLGRRRLRVIATPGHAEDGMMLADDENKLLFTGDTVYPGPLYAYLAGSVAETYKATLEALAGEFSGYTLICSHNAPVMEGGALGEIAQGFAAIAGGMLPGEDYFGYRHYKFEGFSIVLG